VLKLTYGNVELENFFEGMTPGPSHQGRGREGMEGRDGLSLSPVTNSCLGPWLWLGLGLEFRLKLGLVLIKVAAKVWVRIRLDICGYG